MKQKLTTHIEGRNIHIAVLEISGRYEFVLSGEGFEPDDGIRMWEMSKDVGGVDAEKVFNLAVHLIKKGEDIKKVFKKINTLVDAVSLEKDKIEELFDKMYYGSI